MTFKHDFKQLKAIWISESCLFKFLLIFVLGCLL